MFSLRLFVLILFFFFTISPAGVLCSFAQEGCPFNAVNCPGRCGRVIDENRDGICDYSIIVDTVENNAINHVNMTSDTQIIELHQENKNNQKYNNHKNHKILTNECKPEPESESDDSIVTSIEPLISELPKKSKVIRPYNLILYSSITLLAYFISLLLKNFHVYTAKTHRHIWNILLLLTFLVTGIIGILMTIQVNYGVFVSYFISFRKWHVECGIAMVIISIIHIVRHWKYFLSILKNVK